MYLGLVPVGRAGKERWELMRDNNAFEEKKEGVKGTNKDE